MKLGVFLLSLAAKNFEISKSFYKKLGFHVFGEDRLRIGES